MPPRSSTSTRCVNTLAGATGYSPAPSEDREALQQLMTQQDAEARLLPLVGDPSFSMAGQCYAFEGLQSLKGAGAALALRRAAEMGPEQSELSTHFDLYQLARTLPVAALLKQHDAGEDAILAMTEDAELRTVGELARYCLDVGDDGGGTIPLADDSCSFQGADETVRALRLECGNTIPLATLSAVVQSALELLALTKRARVERSPTLSMPPEKADAAVGDEEAVEEVVGGGAPHTHTSDVACGPD